MNINTQICKKLTSGPKIARYFFDHTWLKDYLNRSTIVRQLICVFLTCSLNLCSNMTCFANLCSNMTRTSGAHLPAEVALAAATCDSHDLRARPAWRERRL